MNLPFYGNLRIGINFEYNVDAEGMQGFEKMKNVCLRNDTNVIADIKAYCREDGPICFTPDNGIACSSANPIDIDIIWTSINADSCTVTPKKPAWPNSPIGAHSFRLTQQKTTFTLDCVKDGIHSSDSVTIYCKSKDGQDVCPVNAP